MKLRNATLEAPTSFFMIEMQSITQSVISKIILLPIFYILGNTLGAFIGRYINKIHDIGGKIYVNPDGLEWKRSKWIKPIQMYLKYSEKKWQKKQI